VRCRYPTAVRNRADMKKIAASATRNHTQKVVRVDESMLGDGRPNSERRPKLQFNSKAPNVHVGTDTLRNCGYARSDQLQTQA